MKLSIIIPVYNTAKYLTRCLDSVFFQDLSCDEYEVIVINDGSTDNSLGILRDYETRYKNLVLLTQVNMGEAATRNKAISLAKGTYIAFVDSDDAISENTLLAIMKYIESCNLDLLYLNIHHYNEQGEFLQETDPVGCVNVIKEGLSHPRRTFPATIYRRTLIGDIKYPSGIPIGPDTVFNAKVHFKATKVSYWDVPYYKYTQRADSLSKQGHSEKAFIGFLKAIEEIYHFERTNSSKSELENKYYSALYTIFITRIVELNIIPLWDKTKYNNLKALLNELNNTNELINISSRYKYIHKSFLAFMYYQKYLEFKSTIYKRFFK